MVPRCSFYDPIVQEAVRLRCYNQIIRYRDRIDLNIQICYGIKSVLICNCSV